MSNSSVFHSISLAESKILNNGAKITRVPGGWVYETLTKGTDSRTNSAAVFIPYSTEFAEPLETSPDVLVQTISTQQEQIDNLTKEYDQLESYLNKHNWNI